ncbi:MAG: tol-pal system YbgF family protein [Nitrospinota bacterium]
MREKGLRSGWSFGLGVPLLASLFILLSFGDALSERPEEKLAIPLPEVVVVGKDVDILKELKGRPSPPRTLEGLKELPPPFKKLPAPHLERLPPRRVPKEEPVPVFYGNPTGAFFARLLMGERGLYLTGLFHYQHGNCEEALRSFEEILARRKVNSWALWARYWRGECLLRLGREEDALSQWALLAENGSDALLYGFSLYARGWLRLEREQTSW